MVVSTPFKWSSSGPLAVVSRMPVGTAPAVRNAQLAILPATTHYDIFISPKLADVTTRFLDEPTPEKE